MKHVWIAETYLWIWQKPTVLHLFSVSGRNGVPILFNDFKNYAQFGPLDCRFSLRTVTTNLINTKHIFKIWTIVSLARDPIRWNVQFREMLFERGFWVSDANYCVRHYITYPAFGSVSVSEGGTESRRIRIPFGLSSPFVANNTSQYLSRFTWRCGSSSLVFLPNSRFVTTTFASKCYPAQVMHNTF